MHDLIAAFFSAILPDILMLFSALLTVIIGAAANAARQRWKIQIDTSATDMLHRTLMSGILAALSKGLGGSAAVDFAIAHAQTSAPQTLKKLRPPEAVLRNIAMAKLQEAISPKPK